MKLSIVIPVYNMEKYVERCLESVISQPSTSFEDFEIIVVNDGSIDKSQEIIESFDWKGIKHILLEKENGGLSDARNFGFSYVNGEYVWFVDSDDWIDADCINKILPHLENVDVVHFPKYYRNTDVDENIKGFESYAKSGVELATDNYQYPVQFSIYRTDFLKNNKLSFQLGIVMEDLHFTPRALYKAESIKILNFPVYHYYQRCGSIMNEKVTKKRLLDRIWISKNLYEFMNDNVSQVDKRRWSECIVTDVNAIMFDAFRSHDYGLIKLSEKYINNVPHLTKLLSYSKNINNRLWYWLGKLLFGNFFIVYSILFKLRYGRQY